MTSRRLLLFVLLGLAAWAAYMVAKPAIEALAHLRLEPEKPDTPVHSGAPDPRDWETLVDLRGEWDFQIGDNPAWAAATPPGGDWDRVFVPAAWENEGFFGYDGYAWYRTTFQLNANAEQRSREGPLFLILGRIDDADEVWLNGTFLDRGGRMPPLYSTASFDFRIYRIPPDLLRSDGDNALAIRVYDSGLQGGILEGPVALAAPTARNLEHVPFVADLAGTWQFQPGDNPAWAVPDLDASAWPTLRVPGVWEIQGFPDVDGFAWLRTTVTLTERQLEDDLVLVFGAIDDIDQTFVNGVQVGSTGDFETLTVNATDWQNERAYPVPRRALQAGENVIAVRVFDVMFDGGVYQGPVGLMTAEAYQTRQSLRR
ncbi:MAG: beta galactosidase jelly roll domain-containing protein [Bacteroidota bacterium]